MASRSVDGRYRRYVASAMEKRIPAIVRTAAEGFDKETRARLAAIGRAIAADAPMIADLRRWPFLGWDALPARVNGRRVKEAPFFDFEYWFYLRILEAVRFAERHVDPFRATKHRDLDRHLSWADEAVQKTRSLPEALRLSLDANAHDLSQVVKPGTRYEAGIGALASASEGVRRIDLIADNFGGEFIGDLVLGIVAAEQGIETVFHVKQLPIFVSDTTADDVTILLDRLPRDGAFGPRLRRAIERGTIRFSAEAIWSAPAFLDQLPAGVLGEGEGTLTILKGDLNFRRAVGDAVVPVETPFEQLAVLPAVPMLSLRSIKSYCAVGMAGVWPDALSRDDFPTDGSITAVQHIPARTSVSGR